jgi:myo-inositol 2-dehydrogenase/D-chiro-inositol 1-dehydrogenase
MRELKVGMISFAHGHANSYINSLASIPEVKIVGIADENKDRVAKQVDRYGVAYCADYRELLEMDVDAVVICSENVHHIQHILDSANAKKHILCEKPLGISVEEMRRAIRICDMNGIELMTAFPCRYLPAVVQAKNAVDRGDIGDIVAIKGKNRGSLPGGWFTMPALSGGGALLDHTVHVMDLMNWFIGSEVTEVYAYAATLFNEELQVDDAGMISVKFANGAFGVLDTSWSRPKCFPTWGDVTMEIVGSKGVISVDGLAQKNEFYSDDIGKGLWTYWGDSMDHHMIKSFVQAILQGKRVPITGTDGLRSTEVALAGYESARKDHPVRI